MDEHPANPAQCTVTAPMYLVAQRATAHLALGQGLRILSGGDGRLDYVFLFTDKDRAERFTKSLQSPEEATVVPLETPRAVLAALEKLVVLGHKRLGFDAPALGAADLTTVAPIAVILKAARICAGLGGKLA